MSKFILCVVIFLTFFLSPTLTFSQEAGDAFDDTDINTTDLEQQQQNLTGDQNQAAAPNAPATAGRSNCISGVKNKPEVVAPALKDDKNMTEGWMRTLIPDDVNRRLVAANRLDPDVEVGVEQGLQGLACSFISGIPLIGESLRGNFCPAEVNLVNKKTTKLFANRAESLALAERPEDLEPIPDKTDPKLKDFEDNCNQEADGNEQIDKINTSLDGGDDGVYTLGLPDISLQITEEEKKKRNLQINNQSLSQDERVPGVNNGCSLYHNSFYPTNAGPCKQ